MWHTRPLAAFDIESTGVDTATDRIVSAALWRIDPTHRTKDVTTWLADPGIDIPPEATAVHGITTDRAQAEGRPAAEVVAEIGAAVERAVLDGLPIVVFNAPYDLTLLSAELARHGRAVAFDGHLRVVDPLVLDKRFDRFRRGSRKLVDMCRMYGVPLAEEEAHGAAADALAAARLAWALARKYEDLGCMDLDALHTAQVGWKAEQSASFQDYLRRTKDPDAVIDGSWPLAPPPSRPGDGQGPARHRPTG
ncbi:exonuclease domain-containing protein [Nocardiopsis dassonvillei]|uniref:exonuclease domain-containing protein n=1 Tax=Nocardiopsis dassonvillei TaxID=2014 RepID=UPI00200DF113|nr:exonuclease domain-containing protein [Nocardiopsis dassonvillei]MCK9871367.1 exonuclease domain-containing protein [Nocardiopsis dassonvillei]